MKNLNFWSQNAWNEFLVLIHCQACLSHALTFVYPCSDYGAWSGMMANILEIMATLLLEPRVALESI